MVHKYQSLRDLPRPIRSVNYSTGFDQGMKTSEWEEDEGSAARSVRVGGEGAYLSQLAARGDDCAWQVLYRSDYDNVPIAEDDHVGGEVDRRTITH